MRSFKRALKAIADSLRRWLYHRRLTHAVLYDPLTNSFLYIAAWQGNTPICTLTECYGDARRSTSRFPLSEDHLKGCQEIKTLDNFEHARWEPTFSGWRVKER